MENYMKQVAAMVGVKFNEDFECNASYATYRFTEHSFLCNGVCAADSLLFLLCGVLTVKDSYKIS